MLDGRTAGVDRKRGKLLSNGRSLTYNMSNKQGRNHYIKHSVAAPRREGPPLDGQVRRKKSSLKGEKRGKDPRQIAKKKRKRRRGLGG